jgi:hypothetical protein
VKAQIIGILSLFVLAVVGRSLGIDLSYLQLAALPIILFIFVKLLPVNFRVGRGVALAALVLGLIGVSLSFNLYSFKSGGILVARFIDDPLEDKTRIFRSQLNLIFKRFDSTDLIIRHPTPLKGKVAAIKLLESQKRLGVVWGNSGVVNAAFRAPDNSTLEELLGPSIHRLGLPKLGDFYVARAVGSVSIANTGKSPIDLFLAYLFLGVDSSDPLKKMSYLSQAFSISGPWRWYDHLALPYFIYGTEKLLEAVNNGVYEPAELACAETNLRWAIQLLAVDKSDRHLRAAALNNHAIATYVKFHLEGIEKLRGESLRQFKAAARGEIKIKDARLARNIKLIAKSNYLNARTKGKAK